MALIKLQNTMIEEVEIPWNKPTLLKGFCRDMKAVKKWNDVSYLKTNFMNAKVDVEYYKTETDFETSISKIKSMRFNEYFDQMGDRTYDLSKVQGGLTDKEYDALSKVEQSRLNSRLQIYRNQNKEELYGVGKFKPIDVNSVTNGINISASYEGSNGSVVVIDNSSNGTGNNNENESELVILGGGNDDGSADALYKGG